MSVPMELSKIIITEGQDHQVIVLKETAGERRFPMVIGKDVADAIERRLKGKPPTRPMTHELLADVIDHLGGSLERIEITNLQDGIFFARLFIRQDGQLIEVDSRPSDAIALGIASSVPISVAAHVLDEVCG